MAIRKAVTELPKAVQRVIPSVRHHSTHQEKAIQIAARMPVQRVVTQFTLQCAIRHLRSADQTVGRQVTSTLVAAGMKVTKPLWKGLFYAGESVSDLHKAAQFYRDHKVGIIFQGAREASYTQKECVKAAQEYIDAIKSAKSGDLIAVKPTALILTDDIIKMSKGESLDPKNPQLALAIQVVTEAKQKGIRILWDAEGAQIQDTINHVGWTLQSVANQDGPCVYNTYQIHKGNTPVQEGIALAKAGGYCHAGKYVKGAYDYKLPNVQAAFDAYQQWAETLPNTPESAAIFGTHNPVHVETLIKREIPFGTLMGFSTNLALQYAGPTTDGFKSNVAIFYGDKKCADLFFGRRAEEVLDMHPVRAADQYTFWKAAAQTLLRGRP